MFFAFALGIVGIILIDAGFTQRSVMDVINNVHPVKDTTASGGASGATIPVNGLSAYPSFAQPFAAFIIGRVDQGLDISAKPGTPLPALFGTSRYVGTIPNWYNGQPFIWYEVLDGPLKGRFYYYAEQVTNMNHGTVPKGSPVGFVAMTGTGVEAGFCTANGTTLAHATTGYQEGQQTPAGLSFKQAVGA